MFYTVIGSKLCRFLLVYLANFAINHVSIWKLRMNANERAQYEAGATIMKALAHPTRLFIIDMLVEKGECCVCELTKVIGSDASTVSRHLAELKNVGIIRSDKRGQMVFYHLHVKCVVRVFECIKSVAKSNANHHAKLLANDRFSDCGCN